MGSHITAHEALMLHVMAVVEECDVSIHRSGMGYLEVSLLGKGRIAFIETDGQVTEYHGDRSYQRWPTDMHSRTRLSALYPSVARRLLTTTSEDARGISA